MRIPKIDIRTFFSRFKHYFSWVTYHVYNNGYWFTWAKQLFCTFHILYFYLDTCSARTSLHCNRKRMINFNKLSVLISYNFNNLNIKKYKLNIVYNIKHTYIILVSSYAYHLWIITKSIDLKVTIFKVFNLIWNYYIFYDF